MKNRLMSKVTAIVLALMLLPMSVNAKVSTTSEAADNIEQMMNYIINNYVGSEDVSEEALYEAAMKGMFDSLDIYSEFYQKQEDYENLIQDVDGEFGGIGIEYTIKDGYALVIKNIGDSAAKKAGIKPDDLITEIDGKDIKGLNINQMRDLISGKVGTEVELTIKRKDKTFKTKVKRQIVKENAVKVIPLKDIMKDKSIKTDEDIWYINIDSFNKNLPEDFEKVVVSAKEKGVKGIILDVRNNGGGLVNSVIEMCRQIIPDGPIMHTVTKKGVVNTIYSTLKKSPFKMVVIANEHSASATEVLVGAIKDSRAGIIVGEKTFGKGVVQNIYNYGDFRFKLTVEEYLTRNETHINKVGIKPHVTVHVPSYIAENNRICVKGSESTTVLEIKDILKFLGYDIKSVDGIYDDNTVEVVKQFQKDNELEITGNCDYDTMGDINVALYKSLKKEDPQLQSAIKIIRGLVKSM